MFRYLSTVLLLACAPSFLYSQDVDLGDTPIDTFVKLCPRFTDDYPACCRHAIEEAWPRITAGIPELHIPLLDPLVIGNVNGTTAFGLMKGKFDISNLTAIGFSNAHFLSVDPKHEDGRFHLEMQMYQFEFFVEGDYATEGDFSLFKIQGIGHMNISMTDVTTTVVLDGPVINDRWFIETVSITPDIGDMEISATDLFNGNKILTDAALAFINTFWKIFYGIALPIASQPMNAMVRDYLNEVFANVSFAEAFP